MSKTTKNKMHSMLEEHPNVKPFASVFFRSLLGILLPTCVCGFLLYLAGLYDLPMYLVDELRRASLGFSSVSLLFVELVDIVKHPIAHEHPLFLPFGLALFGIGLMSVCGLALNEEMLKRGFEVARLGITLPANLLLVISIPFYIASWKVLVSKTLGLSEADSRDGESAGSRLSWREVD